MDIATQAVMFGKASDEWETPQSFFDALNREFRFGLDAAATRENTKCPDYLGPDRDDPRFRDALAVSWRFALDFTWGEWHRAIWLNPPYSKCAEFVAKAAAEQREGVTTVMLIPARTDTRYFHAHIYDAEKHQPRERVEIRFVKGRLKFGTGKNSAPFPSMVVIFRGLPT
jgi:phage N-6-adenine-methyltransferase